VEIKSVSIQPNYQVEREFAGEVQAGQNSSLGFELAGKVDEVLVDEGDAVTRGQVLARLDTRLLETERTELQAGRSELQAELDLAQRNLQRISRLQQENLASERDRDELSSRTQVLTASLQKVDAAIHSNQIRLEKSVLKAPFSSTIASREIDGGVVVDAGTPVLRLVETGAREVHAGIPVTVADQMRVGDEVSLRNGSHSATGIVTGIGPTVNPSTLSRTARVLVQADWSPGALAYVRMDVAVDVPGAWLPATAVTEGARGTWVVYAIKPVDDGRTSLETRSVVIHHANNERLFVSGALTDGDDIVASGLHRVAPGMEVRTVRLNTLADAR